MKKKCIILTIFLIVISSLFAGCQTAYPQNALFVGKNCEFSTIQSAIDSANESGQYVVLKSGVYKENLIIDKPIKLVGKTDSVVINGTVNLKTSGIQLERVVISGKNLGEVDGLSVDNAEKIEGLKLNKMTITDFNGHGFFSSSETEVLKNCSFREINFLKNSKSGFYANNLSASTFVDCVFDKNGKETTSAGLKLEYFTGNHSGISISACDFDNNKVGLFLNKSISATYDGRIVVDNCMFNNNERDISLDKNEESRINIEVLNSRGIRAKTQYD